jgi:hypothetical protein
MRYRTFASRPPNEAEVETCQRRLSPAIGLPRLIVSLGNRCVPHNDSLQCVFMDDTGNKVELQSMRAILNRKGHLLQSCGLNVMFYVSGCSTSLLLGPFHVRRGATA